MERYYCEYQKGLNDEQVKLRQQQGLINACENTNTKTYKQIFHDNLFTLFNFINAVLAGFILLTGSFRNLLFLGVVFSNIIIGTVQEIRAKRVLDKISLLVSSKVCVIRNGEKQMIAVAEVVLDDILYVKSGSQIVADSYVVFDELEVDESLLSGESDSVIKKKDDFLYSGSFVVGGSAYIRVHKVGSDCYASQMVKDAKKQMRHPSQLRDSLNKIIKYIGIAIIPIGILLFIKHYFIAQETLTTSILSISAALIGMIPEGLVILTSIALAVGTIHLAKHKTLVQELFCLETLARVDVLCLDKTGTITEGKMEVDNYHSLMAIDEQEIFGNLVRVLKDDNATINAISDYYLQENSLHEQQVISFTSKKKYSGVIFKEKSYFIGAYEFLVANPQAQQVELIHQFAMQGYRVITLIQSDEKQEDQILVNNEVVGFLLLLDKIRESAKETMDYFHAQNVAIKVISGDHPITVSQVAKRAGLEGYEHYVDATTLHSEEEIEEAVAKYNIFGRVSPQQKKAMVVALKKQGHIVGMSGDGVNDVLAFKEANISIAMASGSDVAKASANLVLLESNFDALPFVLFEGRRVINNIQRVATLFLTKTIFSILLSLLTLLVAFRYPFIPIHLTFVSTLTIGIPAFFLAIEPNRNRVQKNFMEQVLKISLPAAMSVILCIIYIYVSSMFIAMDDAVISQLSLIVISINGLIVLSKIARPYTKMRIALVVIIYVLVMNGLLFGARYFAFTPIDLASSWYHILIFVVLLLIFSHVGTKIVTSIYDKKQ